MERKLERKHGGNYAQDGRKDQSGSGVAVNEAVAHENTRGLHWTIPPCGGLLGSERVVLPKHASRSVRNTFRKKSTDSGNDDTFLVHHGHRPPRSYFGTYAERTGRGTGYLYLPVIS